MWKECRLPDWEVDKMRQNEASILDRHHQSFAHFILELVKMFVYNIKHSRLNKQQWRWKKKHLYSSFIKTLMLKIWANLFHQDHVGVF